ncbi:histone H2B-like [Capricornis sumatraensis]|uniref:histone H2B-like n=1 Tax=Capricornis sumatraensis TaxID=34865 RepID=UPI003604DBF4
MDSVCDVRESRAYKFGQRPSTPSLFFRLSWGSGVAAMSEPTPNNSEEDVITKEMGTSETEPSDTEMAKAGASNQTCVMPNQKRVLKQVHTGLSLSRESVNILDSFVKDMFERIAEEAGRLAHCNRRCTMMTEDIQTAVRLLLPGELGKYATSEATKTVIRYRTSR